jgi:hypothetical protein
MGQLAGGVIGGVWRALRRLQHAWHVLLALAVVNALDSLLTDDLTLWTRLSGPDAPGPHLVDASLTTALFVALVVSLLLGWARLAWLLTLGLLASTTLQLIYSVVMLVATLPFYPEGVGAFTLLLDGMIVWTINVLIFAIWYWTLDGGGPERRHAAPLAALDFLFPLQVNAIPGHEGWQPHFLDYLFLAFGSSTAFSATDTLIVSRRAKALTMLQAAISLLTITIVTARAVNIIR